MSDMSEVLAAEEVDEDEFFLELLVDEKVATQPFALCRGGGPEIPTACRPVELLPIGI